MVSLSHEILLIPIIILFNEIQLLALQSIKLVDWYYFAAQLLSCISLFTQVLRSYAKIILWGKKIKKRHNEHYKTEIFIVFPALCNLKV